MRALRVSSSGARLAEPGPVAPLRQREALEVPLGQAGRRWPPSAPVPSRRRRRRPAPSPASGSGSAVGRRLDHEQRLVGQRPHDLGHVVGVDAVAQPTAAAAASRSNAAGETPRAGSNTTCSAGVSSSWPQSSSACMLRWRRGRVRSLLRRSRNRCVEPVRGSRPATAPRRGPPPARWRAACRRDAGRSRPRRRRGRRSACAAGRRADRSTNRSTASSDDGEGLDPRTAPRPARPSGTRLVARTPTRGHRARTAADERGRRPPARARSCRGSAAPGAGEVGDARRRARPRRAAATRRRPRPPPPPPVARRRRVDRSTSHTPSGHAGATWQPDLDGEAGLAHAAGADDGDDAAGLPAGRARSATSSLPPHERGARRPRGCGRRPGRPARAGNGAGARRPPARRQSGPAARSRAGGSAPIGWKRTAGPQPVGSAPRRLLGGDHLAAVGGVDDPGRLVEASAM